jgi:hypothetical protein
VKELLQQVFSKARVAEIQAQMQKFAGEVEARRQEFYDRCREKGGSAVDCQNAALALKEKVPEVDGGRGFFFWIGVLTVVGGTGYGVYRWRKRRDGKL